MNSEDLSEHPVLGNEATLSEKGEKAFCNYIEYMATRSFHLTVDQVIMMVAPCSLVRQKEGEEEEEAGGRRKAGSIGTPVQ